MLTSLFGVTSVCMKMVREPSFMVGTSKDVVRMPCDLGIDLTKRIEAIEGAGLACICLDQVTGNGLCVCLEPRLTFVAERSRFALCESFRRAMPATTTLRSKQRS